MELTDSYPSLLHAQCQKVHVPPVITMRGRESTLGNIPHNFVGAPQICDFFHRTEAMTGGDGNLCTTRPVTYTMGVARRGVPHVLQ